MKDIGLTKKVIAQINNVFAQQSEVEKVTLYGSRAKGNYKNGSDIDITLCGNNINLTVLNKLSTSLDDLLLPYTFDISIYKHIDNKALIQHIQNVGKTFYIKNRK